jgi:hypothetical protein
MRFHRLLRQPHRIEGILPRLVFPVLDRLSILEADNPCVVAGELDAAAPPPSDGSAEDHDVVPNGQILTRLHRIAVERLGPAQRVAQKRLAPLKRRLRLVDSREALDVLGHQSGDSFVVSTVHAGNDDLHVGSRLENAGLLVACLDASYKR